MWNASVILFALSSLLALWHIDAVKADKNNFSFQKAAVDPLLTCPKDFTLEGNGCVKVTREAPKLICPKKSKMTEEGCIVTDYFEAQNVCPEGYSMKGKTCYKVEGGPTMSNCPKGYDLVGNECISKKFSATKYKCPKGYTLTGSECILAEKVSSNIVCPRAYDLDKSGNCVMHQYASPTPTCPKGYHLEGLDCIKAVMYNSQVECPKGYKLEKQNGLNDKCVKHAKVEPQPICAKGVFDGKKTCSFANSVEMLAECPKNYNLVNGRCTYITEMAPDMECADKNFHLKDGRCIKIHHFKPEMACPPGYILNKNKCSKEEAIPTTKECHDDHIMLNGECVKELTKELETACPKGYQNDGLGTCKSVISVKADYTCEQGEMKGKSCISTEVTSPKVFCTEGSLTNEECMHTVHGPLQFHCPKGYDMDITGQCVQLQHVDPAYICPAGSTQTLKGHCEVKVSSNPQISCPKGYTAQKRADGISSQPQDCVKEETINAQYQCPPGMYLKHDLCYSAHRLETTIKKKK